MTRLLIWMLISPLVTSIGEILVTYRRCELERKPPISDAAWGLAGLFDIATYFGVAAFLWWFR